MYAFVDGMNCSVNEEHPFSCGWYSHKCRRTLIRYDVGLTLHSGRLVWVSRQFEFWSYHNNKIVKYDLKGALPDRQSVIADIEYNERGLIRIELSEILSNDIHQRVRTRNEAVNEKLKYF